MVLDDATKPQALLSRCHLGMSVSVMHVCCCDCTTYANPLQHLHNINLNTPKYIQGRNTITQADQTAGRQYGFGWTTNIINGGIECNQPVQLAQRHRIEFFTAYCGNMSISTGSALNCANQKSY